MKISFVEPHLELFGGIRRIIELSNRLITLGESVTIYHPAGTPCEWMECRALVKPLADVVADEHDAVIFNDPPHYKIVRRTTAPLKVFYILGLYERERLKRFSFKILWPKKGRVVSIKRIMQLPFLKITNATWMQEFLERELGVHAELVIGGVNRDVFHPVAVEKNRSEFHVLATGDPRKYKGMDTVNEAIDIVRQSHPAVILDTYYGKGIPQNRMAETYSRADLFVDAQWNTGCGWNNPVAEAMACNVPVICSDIGGVRDFAIHRETAILVPERDPSRLAKEIIGLMEHHDTRTAIQQKAYEKIIQFDWDSAAAALQKVLKTAVRRGKYYK
jgi:glycosyltransferase involved in cell wall biosynthesis